jgi:hypothetical protein
VADIENDGVNGNCEHNYLKPHDLNTFQEQIPQQIARMAMNNAAAAIKLIFNPKKGKISKPTSGRVHIQTVMASAISSK